MKKLLAMTLALVLALGLASPALAEEVEVRWFEGDLGDLMEPISADETTELKSIADEPPEVQEFLREMYEGGLLQENTSYDLSYFEGDPYAAYEAAHPEEFENMDVDALIAGWGYEDKTAQEQFLDDWAWRWEDDETLEALVRDRYIMKRVAVQDTLQTAQGDKEDYPEEWAAFDAQRFFDSYIKNDRDDECASKEAYMAYYNILTQEEFVDYMFVKASWRDFPDPDTEPDDKPTLILMVNGAASDVTVSASGGVTYADAADLRSILGDQAVGQGYEGLAPIRETAENAGWDVVWYDDWGWQEVQLWNRAAFGAELADEFGPYEDFAARLAEQNKAWLETATGLTETMELKLTRFDTLDGNRTYTAKVKVEMVAEDGVVDCVMNVDAAGFGALLDVARQAGWTAEDAAVAQMKKVMGDVKVEVVADLKAGVAAYRAPALALLDPALADWRRLGLGSVGGVISYDSVLDAGYQTMMENAAVMGGKYAWNSAMAELERQVTTLGADRFATATDGTVTYTLTTQDIGEMTGSYKRCEARCVAKPDGRYTLDLAVRPDLGSALGFGSYLDTEDILQVLAYDLLGSFLDMEAAVKMELGRDKAEMSIDFHWSNFGRLELAATARKHLADCHPRQIAEVLPPPMIPAEGSIITRAK